jgi:hypothetical protein
MRTYTVPAVASAPTGSPIYVAPAAMGGRDSNQGTLGNPKLTLAAAIAAAPSSGGQIVLRKGIYRTERNIDASGKSNLTIKGYATDIAADPLDPANWPILDGSFTGVTWEPVNVTSSYHEYRTTANFSTGNPQGMVVSGLTYKIPRWEPKGGMRVPTRLFRLYPYFNQSGGRGYTSFRSTAAVTGTGQHTAYLGPGVMRETTGRVHIRLDPVDDGMYNEHIDKIADKNPANNTVCIWQQDKTLFSSVSSGFTLAGVFIRGYDRLLASSGVSNVTIRRNVIWLGHFSFGMFNTAGSSGATFANWTMQHNVFDCGMCEWLSHATVKATSLPGSVYGQQVVIWETGSRNHWTNFKVLDNLCVSPWAFLYLNDLASDSDVEVAYNASGRHEDDFFIFPAKVGKQHIHHNWVIGAGPGTGTVSGAPSTYKVYDHHNVYISNICSLWNTHDRRSCMIYTPHGSTGGKVYHEYQNTYIHTHPTPYNTGGNLARPMPGYSGGSVPSRRFNSIIVVYPQVPPGGSSPGDRWQCRDMSPLDPTYKMFFNGNCYWNLLGPGVTGGKVFWSQIYTGNRSAGTNATYATLADWRASATYNSTSGTGWAFGGRKMEQDSIEANPAFSDPNAITQDPRFDVPPSDYRPTASGCLSGAVNITSLGWPGATSYQAWRGALNPAGDGTEIGPRAAS